MGKNPADAHVRVCVLDVKNKRTASQTSDQEKCNWMCFVRAATNATEQNLDARTINGRVFFTTIRDVKPDEELKVGGESVCA